MLLFIARGSAEKRSPDPSVIYARTGRLPHLQVGGSPWVDVHGGDAAMNTSIEGPEVEKWRSAFTKTQALLAAANAKLGSNVTIGCAQFDVESFSWSPNYQGDSVRLNASFRPRSQV